MTSDDNKRIRKIGHTAFHREAKEMEKRSTGEAPGHIEETDPTQPKTDEEEKNEAASRTGKDVRKFCNKRKDRAQVGVVGDRKAWCSQCTIAGIMILQAECTRHEGRATRGSEPSAH